MTCPNPCLLVVASIGVNDSTVYLQVGIKVLLHHMPESVSQADLIAIVRQTCSDATIDGLLVQVTSKLACLR